MKSKKYHLIWFLIWSIPMPFGFYILVNDDYYLALPIVLLAWFMTVYHIGKYSSLKAKEEGNK
ncbi:hypothetical protein A9299_10025 [Moraxella osloensis]|uniref:Uncharacterized protein n=1 Tax=Faucicola osloensis TaxID=34062 RepID=A0AA91FT28_FAUOS|nr:hypothetical protein A9299_10025 [Moraxella osloensis]